MKYCLTSMIAVIMILSLNCYISTKKTSNDSLTSLSMTDKTQSILQIIANTDALIDETKSKNKSIIVNSTNNLSSITKKREDETLNKLKIENIKQSNWKIKSTKMIHATTSSFLTQKLSTNKSNNLPELEIQQNTTTEPILNDLIFNYRKESKILNVLSGRRSKVRLGLI
jgi:hypothetical protein